VIDITLTKNLKGVHNWRVNESYNGTDHNTIEYELRGGEKSTRKYRNWDKIDWKLFRDKLGNSGEKNNDVSTVTQEWIDSEVSKIYKQINGVLNEISPLIDEEIKGKGNRRYNSNLRRLGRKTEKLHQKMKANPNIQNIKRYVRSNRQYKKACQRERNNDWKYKKQTLTKTKCLASLLKRIQRKGGETITTIKKADGEHTRPGKETLKELIRTHFPASSKTKKVEYNKEKKVRKEELKTLFPWINSNLIRIAFEGFKSKKSPGPDGLRPMVLKWLPIGMIKRIETLYKASIKLQYVPKEWKRTSVIFISKPGKEDYNRAKSFRPISLSNYILKGWKDLWDGTWMKN
jgi:hypothetical protein